MIPKFALIGFGAIATELVSYLIRRQALDHLTGVLVLPRSAAIARGVAAGRFPVVDHLPALLALKPDLVIECAGHAAVVQYGDDIVSQGHDLLVTSVGALAQQETYDTLASATRSGGRVLIHSGAVAGIDGLRAVRDCGLAAVTYSSIKPPAAWKDTAAEASVDLDALVVPATIFNGTAREAAVQFPKNANVGAMIAFAGIGLDRTRVKLIADPKVGHPLGVIQAESDLGRFRFETLAFASSSNPKTSLLTAHSIVHAIEAGWVFSPFDSPA
jgi:aspartate dehydrogenase